MRLQPHIPYSEAAEEILLGTAVQESRLKYLRQIGGGPARGLYQIEPNTHDDHYLNFLNARPQFERLIRNMAGRGANLHDELVTNMVYATAMARLKYYRSPGALPEPTDIEGMARYYKTYFNTAGGKGTVDEFIDHYNKHVLKR